MIRGGRIHPRDSRQDTQADRPRPTQSHSILDVWAYVPPSSRTEIDPGRRPGADFTQPQSPGGGNPSRHPVATIQGERLSACLSGSAIGIRHRQHDPASFASTQDQPRIERTSEGSMPLRVVILGANGFIGSALTAAILRTRDWEVYGIDLSNHKLGEL